MIHSLNLFDSGFNSPYAQRPTPSKEVQAIQNSLHTGQKKLEELNKEELASLKAFESADHAAWLAEITHEISRTEAIARKIVKGEPLTSEEERFINEKNPNLKREAEEAKTYSKKLSIQLKSAKSKGQQQAILSTAVTSVITLQQTASPIQIQLKMDAIFQAKKEAHVTDEDGTILTGLRPGSLFDCKR